MELTVSEAPRDGCRRSRPSSNSLLDLCVVKLVKVAGTEYHVHELKTQLKKVGEVKVVVSWQEADLSDSLKYHATTHRCRVAKAEQ